MGNETSNPEESTDHKTGDDLEEFKNYMEKPVFDKLKWIIRQCNILYQEQIRCIAEDLKFEIGNKMLEVEKVMAYGLDQLLNNPDAELKNPNVDHMMHEAGFNTKQEEDFENALLLIYAIIRAEKLNSLKIHEMAIQMMRILLLKTEYNTRELSTAKFFNYFKQDFRQYPYKMIDFQFRDKIEQTLIKKRNLFPKEVMRVACDQKQFAEYEKLLEEEVHFTQEDMMPANMETYYNQSQRSWIKLQFLNEIFLSSNELEKGYVKDFLVDDEDDDSTNMSRAMSFDDDDPNTSVAIMHKQKLHEDDDNGTKVKSTNLLLNAISRVFLDADYLCKAGKNKEKVQSKQNDSSKEHGQTPDGQSPKPQNSSTSKNQQSELTDQLKVLKETSRLMAIITYNRHSASLNQVKGGGFVNPDQTYKQDDISFTNGGLSLSILQILALSLERSFISSLILNMTSVTDETVLQYLIQIVGNLSTLKIVQNDELLLKTGIKKMGNYALGDYNDRLKLESAQTLYKLATCHSPSLIQQFQQKKVFDRIVKFLNDNHNKQKDGNSSSMSFAVKESHDKSAFKSKPVQCTSLPLVSLYMTLFVFELARWPSIHKNLFFYDNDISQHQTKAIVSYFSDLKKLQTDTFKERMRQLFHEDTKIQQFLTQKDAYKTEPMKCLATKLTQKIQEYDNKKDHVLSDFKEDMKQAKERRLAKEAENFRSYFDSKVEDIKKDKQLTILNFCCHSDNLLFMSLLPFYVANALKAIKDPIMGNSLTREDSICFQVASFSALERLSLKMPSHSKIVTASNLRVLDASAQQCYNYFRDLMTEQLYQETFNTDPSIFGSKILAIVILSNCTCSNEVSVDLWENHREIFTNFLNFAMDLQELNKEDLLDPQKFLKNKQDTNAMKNASWKDQKTVYDISLQFALIWNDCLLSLFLVENFLGHNDEFRALIEFEMEEKDKVRFLLKVLSEVESCSQLFKAIRCLIEITKVVHHEHTEGGESLHDFKPGYVRQNNPESNWDLIHFMYKHKIVQIIDRIFQSPYGNVLMPQLTEFINLIIAAPFRLRIWFKFDMANPGVNSTQGICASTVIVHGGLGYLPPRRGLYSGWGRIFNARDQIEIVGGTDITDRRTRNFTITFWTLLPMEIQPDQTHDADESSNNRRGQKTNQNHSTDDKFHQSHTFRTLCQSASGNAAIYCDRRGMEFRLQDENKQTFSIISKQTRKIEHPSWCHIGIDYNCQKNKLQCYVNGRKDMSVSLDSKHRLDFWNVSFIGNNEKRNQPFGVMADFRAYPVSHDSEFYKEDSMYHPLQEMAMPDKFMRKFLNTSIFQRLIDRIEYDSPHNNVALMRCLTQMATNKDCKQVLIGSGLTRIALKYLNSWDFILSLQIQKLIYNLE